MIGFSSWAIMASPLASTKIGSVFEKEEFTTYYYVNMYPERSASKNYHVKAKICAYTEQYGENDYERRYEIQEAYFPNGGKITFYDNGIDETLKLNKRVSVLDDEDKLWDIELTDVQASD